MPSVSAAALLTTSSPEEIARAGESSIAEARAGWKPSSAWLDPLARSCLRRGHGRPRQRERPGGPHRGHPPRRGDARRRGRGEAAIAKVRTDLSLDRGLFDVLAGLDLADADPATRYYLERTLRDFRRSGVDRDEQTRTRVRALQEELVAIGQDFDRNIRVDTRTAALEPSALVGLPADYVRAHPPGEDGQVRITTEYPDIVPFMMYSTDAKAREQLWRLYRQRGYPSNVDVLRRMLERRHELATLLGYLSWAQYAAEDKMIGTEQNIEDFIERIAAAAADRSRRDYERLLRRKRVDQPDAAAVLPWDASYLDDRVKAEEFALDSQALRPYFEYGRVKEGLMAIIARLFGVEFRPRSDIPVWHPDVECHEVFADGELIGRIFLDMHPRENKYNHAAAFGLTSGKAGVRIAECALVCNLPKPGDEPALLQHSDVDTFFHEFGHLIHGVFGGRTRWHGLSGIATEWDFVEAPSQLLEEWVRDAGTLATFAVHHETGEMLPADLVARLRAADEFGKGLQVRQQMFYASLAGALPPGPTDRPGRGGKAAGAAHPYKRRRRWMHLSFGHLGRYSAIYYTYMWSLVIAKDLFTVFEREGLDSTAAATRYRDKVLAPGGSAPAAELVAGFLGRPYSFDAYQAWLDRD
jgi:thimet oligopeptidase